MLLLAATCSPRGWACRNRREKRPHQSCLGSRALTRWWYWLEKWDLQAEVGAPLPLRLASSIGWSVTGSAALQYRFRRIWWPELEVNDQRWWDGQRNGFTQSYLTPGVEVGALPIGSTGMGAEVAVGYQYALSPSQRERPAFLATAMPGSGPRGSTSTDNHFSIAAGYRRPIR